MNKIFNKLLSKHESEILPWIKKIKLKGDKYLVDLSNIAIEFLRKDYKINALLILNSIATLIPEKVKNTEAWKEVVIKHIEKPGANVYLYSPIMSLGKWNSSLVKEYLKNVDDLHLFSLSDENYMEIFRDQEIVKSFIRIYRKGVQPYMWLGEEYDEWNLSEVKRTINLSFLKAIKDMPEKDLNPELNIDSTKDSIYSYINKIISIRFKIKNNDFESFVLVEDIKNINDLYADLWCLDYFADRSKEIVEKFVNQKLDYFIADQLLLTNNMRGDTFTKAPSFSTFTGKDFKMINRLEGKNNDDLILKIESGEIDFFDMSYATKILLESYDIKSFFELVKNMKNIEAASWLVNPIFKIDRESLLKFHRETRFKYMSIDGITQWNDLLDINDLSPLITVLNACIIKTKDYSFFSYHNTFEGRLFHLIVDLTVKEKRYTDSTKFYLNKIKNSSSLFMKMVEGLQYSLGYIDFIPNLNSFSEVKVFVDTALLMVQASSFIQNEDMAILVARLILNPTKEQHTHILNYITQAIALSNMKVVDILNDAINGNGDFSVSPLEHMLLSDETNIKSRESFKLINEQKWFKNMISKRARWLVRMSIYNEENKTDMFENFHLFKGEFIKCIKEDKYNIEPYNFNYYIYFMMFNDFSNEDVMTVIWKLKKAEPNEWIRSIEHVVGNKKTLEWLRTKLTTYELQKFTKYLTKLKIGIPHQLLV